MLKVFVDSGSSIKQEEKEKYQVEIIPLRYSFGDEDYLDGIDLTIEEFYDKLIQSKQFPKTSLPNLADIEERVNQFVQNGDDVLILPISSQISGTFNAISKLFEGNNKVRVVDTLSVAGGIRLIVQEVNKHRDESLEQLENRIKKFIPRIQILAIPETLNYLLKGGRLSKVEWLLGSVLNIKPVIGIKQGKVKVIAKKMGIKNAMNYIVNALKELRCDSNYELIASYTYNKSNVEKLISITDEKYQKQITSYDNLIPSIGCHWGPNAFGYIFASEEKN